MEATLPACLGWAGLGWAGWAGLLSPGKDGRRMSGQQSAKGLWRWRWRLASSAVDAATEEAKPMSLMEWDAFLKPQGEASVRCGDGPSVRPSWGGHSPPCTRSS